MDLAQVVAVGLVVASHALALRRPWRDLRRRRLPRVVDFATLGVVLFYDLGLVLELAGVPVGAPYFEPLLGLPDWPQWLGALTLLAVMPWLLRAGARLVHRPASRADRPPAPLPTSAWALALPLSLGLAVSGLWLLWRYGTLLDTRAWLRTDLGHLTLGLFLPLYLLGVALGRGETQTRAGRWRCRLLTLCAMAAVAPIPQRTYLLVPPLLLALFGTRRGVPTRRALLVAGAAGLTAAGLLLPLYKAHMADQSRTDHVVAVASDLARTPTLRFALAEAEWVGTHVHPYPGAGYLFAALYYAPRALVPWKPQNPHWVTTAYVLGTEPDRLGWGFVFGVVEELALNLGLAAVPLGLLAWGVAFGWLDRLAANRPGLTIPSRFGPMWMMGYGLVPALITYGGMALVGLACGWLWPARPRRPRRSPEALPVPLLHR